MTQDVLARGTGGAHLHDPDGTPIGEPPSAAVPEFCSDMGSGLPVPVSAPPVPVLPEVERAGVVVARAAQLLTPVEPGVLRASAEVPAASAVRPEIDWTRALVMTETVRAARLTAGLPPDPTVITPDPDATVLIGRHRADGTLSGPDDWWDEPAAPRGGFIGRVAAAVVARWRGGDR